MVGCISKGMVIGHAAIHSALADSVPTRGLFLAKINRVTAPQNFWGGRMAGRQTDTWGGAVIAVQKHWLGADGQHTVLRLTAVCRQN